VSGELLLLLVTQVPACMRAYPLQLNMHLFGYPAFLWRKTACACSWSPVVAVIVKGLQDTQIARIMQQNAVLACLGGGPATMSFTAACSWRHATVHSSSACSSPLLQIETLYNPLCTFDAAAAAAVIPCRQCHPKRSRANSRPAILHQLRLCPQPPRIPHPKLHRRI
jgi:hypothetical protein